MNSAIPAPAAFHTDRPAYVVARDSVLTVVVTYVNRMADTAYFPGWRSRGSGPDLEPRHWILQLWTGHRWVWADFHATVDGWGIPPIRVPPRGMLTHTVRVPAETLRRGLLAARPAAAGPPALDEELFGTYRLLYHVYRAWTGVAGINRPEAPLAESVSNIFTVTIQGSERERS